MNDNIEKQSSGWGKTALMVAISFGILFYLGWRVDLTTSWNTLLGMNTLYLFLAACLASFASYILGGYKWMRILAGLGHQVPYKNVLFVRLGSESVKFIIPAKGGELVRPLYLKSEFGVPLPLGIGSLALDKMFNLFGLLVLFAFGVMLTMGALLSVGVLFISTAGIIFIRWFARPISSWLGAKEDKLYRSVGRLFATLHTLSFGESVFQLLLGGLFLLTEIITGFLSLRAAGVEVPFMTAMTYLPIVILLVQVPLTISGIGTREAGIVVFFGAWANQETLFAVGIAYTVVELIVPVTLGLPFLAPLLQRIQWGKIFSAAQKKNEEHSPAG